jgi:hypothetical protein
MHFAISRKSLPALKSCYAFAADSGREVMRHLFIAALVFAVAPAVAQDREKLSSTELHVHTQLRFKVPDAVVQKLLPAGFELNAPAAGPNKGTNFAIILIDYLMEQDPEGKPLLARTTIPMTIPAKKTATGEPVAVVFNGLVDQAAVPGPYGVYGPAKLTVDRRSQTNADGKSIIDEAWQAKADDGSMLEVQLQFVRGVLARGNVEAKLHSGGKPEFYRHYKVDLVADVARSAATGIDRVNKFSIKATGPRFAPLFNGAEQLISITSVPSYSLAVYVPAM